MDFDEERDENFKKIKNKLNRGKIKLWLPPYLKGNGKKNSKELKKLADSFSEELSIPKESCLMLLEKLQTKGLNNFKDNNKYLSTGEATLKVRVFYEVGEAFLTVGIHLTKTGFDLRLKISREASVIVNRLKVVFRGKFLKDELILKDQSIKHGLHVMGIVLKDNFDVLSQVNDSDCRRDPTVADIALLSKNGYLQGSEHFQKLSDLPYKERKALIIGMQLHQTGRTAIKKGDFALALALLLEAERKFGHYDSSFLRSFGNCCVLNLDIAWCYLNLQSLVLFPDAEERLYQCENDIKGCYGANLERISAGTDFAWTALILSMRLHLLQVAVLYHQNKTFKARIILKQAEEELKDLEVDSRHLSHLIESGYGATESRFAMRATKGDVSKAIYKMDKKRGEMTNKLFEMVKSEKYLKKPEVPEKSSSGAQGESELFKSLIAMGCSEEISRWVIEQRKYTNAAANNAQGEGSEGPGNQNNGNKGIILKTIINIGFKPKKAKAALKKHGGDFDGAVMELFEKEFMLGYESYLEIEDEDEEDDEDDECTDSTAGDGKALGQGKDVSNDSALGDNAAACSNVSESRRPFSSELREGLRVTQLFPEGTENVQYDYIDTSLALEDTFLQKYKALLKK